MIANSKIDHRRTGAIPAMTKIEIIAMHVLKSLGAVSRTHLAAQCGCESRGGPLSLVQSLRDKGIVAVDGEAVRLTSFGMAAQVKARRWRL